MKFYAIALVFMLWMFALPASAQQAEPEFTLKLTGPEINLIVQGLQSGPFAAVSTLLNKMQIQINAQSTPPTNPVATPPITPPKK